MPKSAGYSPWLPVPWCPSIFSKHWLSACHIPRTRHSAKRQIAPSSKELPGWVGRREPRYYFGLARTLRDSSQAGISPFPWADVNLPLVSLVDFLCSVSPAYKAYKHIHLFLSQKYTKCILLLWDTVENKTDKNSCPQGVYITMEKNKQWINKIHACQMVTSAKVERGYAVLREFCYFKQGWGYQERPVDLCVRTWRCERVSQVKECQGIGDCRYKGPGVGVCPLYFTLN